MLPYYGISSLNISAAGIKIARSPLLGAGQVLIFKREYQANEKLPVFLTLRQMKPDTSLLWFIWLRKIWTLTRDLSTEHKAVSANHCYLTKSYPGEPRAKLWLLNVWFSSAARCIFKACLGSTTSVSENGANPTYTG